jgi:hypothetical protein
LLTKKLKQLKQMLLKVSLEFNMEEDMGLSFDATITAKEAKKKLHIPIMIKKDIERNEDENEMDVE